jgi:hypothetical protein
MVPAIRDNGVRMFASMAEVKICPVDRFATKGRVVGECVVTLRITGRPERRASTVRRAPSFGCCMSSTCATDTWPARRCSRPGVSSWAEQVRGFPRAQTAGKVAQTFPCP